MLSQKNFQSQRKTWRSISEERKKKKNIAPSNTRTLTNQQVQVILQILLKVAASKERKRQLLVHRPQ